MKKKTRLTPLEFAEAMSEISNDNGNIETQHADAEELMCETLRGMGYLDGVNIFREMKKRYD